MDAFEQLVAALLEREGFWVRSSVKVRLTTAEKARIGRATSPRWELDIVAYHAATNEIRIVECKSFLFSRGVSLQAFDVERRFAGRFKLFNDRRLFGIVSRRLVRQLAVTGSCQPKPTVRLRLAAGRVVASQREELQRLFQKRGWLLLDRTWLLAGLIASATGGYENNMATVVAKLLDERNLE